MSESELETLLEPISSSDPSGDDLQYDPVFREMRSAVAGQPERSMGESVIPAVEPDWKRAASLAVDLLSRSKDLRIAIVLCEALLRTDGFGGLAKGLMFTHRLIERFWDSVHPKLDPEEGNDPTERVNALSDLCGREAFLNPLRACPLIKSQAFGTVSLRDVAIAEGKTAAPTDADRKPLDMAAINAAFRDCELSELRETTAAVALAHKSIHDIELAVSAHVSAAEAPDLGPVTSILSEAERILTPRLSERTEELDGASETSPGDVGGSGAGTGADLATTPSPGISSEIRGREDVVRILDKICAYYARQEPSSPVPLLLQRARRLVTKDFVEIMRDLAPDALTQIDAIRGPDRDD